MNKICAFGGGDEGPQKTKKIGIYMASELWVSKKVLGGLQWKPWEFMVRKTPR